MARTLSVCVALLLAGGGDTAADSAEILLTRTAAPGQAEMSAIVGGELAIDLDRGCVLLSEKPVVWPAGTTLATDPARVELPNGATARPGDVVSGGGGEVPAGHLRSGELPIVGDVDRALACAPDEPDAVVFTARGDALSVSRG